MEIHEVICQIANVEETASFYKSMGFSVTQQAASATVIVGTSKLTFIKGADSYTYHVAFNIPRNAFYDAKKWLEQHTELVVENGQDAIHFEAMDAHSVYFYDPAGNSMELIARRNEVSDASYEVFSAQTILNIGEIGFVMPHIEQALAVMNTYKIPTHLGSVPSTTSITFFGDEACYIITSPAGRKWIFSSLVATPAPITIHTSYGTISYPTHLTKNQ